MGSLTEAGAAKGRTGLFAATATRVLQAWYGAGMAKTPDRQQFNMLLPDFVKDRLRAHAKAQGISMSAAASLLIQKGLAQTAEITDRRDVVGQALPPAAEEL